MAKILIAETDEISINVMKAALQSHEIGVHSQLGPVLALLQKEPYDLLILDNALLDKGFHAWLEEYKANCPVESNKSIKIVILSFQDEAKKVKSYLKEGALDYIIKPVDRPLFMQKISLLLSSQVEKEVYSFPTTAPVDVARELAMEEVSEFGLTLRTNTPFQIGEVVTFYGSLFKSDHTESVLGRCYAVGDHPENKDEKLARFAFVGVNQAVLKQIRTWMKQEYIRKKQQAA